MTKDGVDICSWAVEYIDECTAMEIRLLEMEVELGPQVLRAGQEMCQDFGFQTLDDLVVELDFAV